MALMQITVIPLGGGSTSVGEFVAAMVDELAAEGVKFKLNDMGTLVEGDASELLRLAAMIHEKPFRMGQERVVTQITIDDRRDRQVAIGDKVSSVERRLKADNS